MVENGRNEVKNVNVGLFHSIALYKVKQLQIIFKDLDFGNDLIYKRGKIDII